MKGGDATSVVAQEGGKRRKSRKSKKSMKGGSTTSVVVQEGGKRRKSRKSKKSMKGGDATSVVAQEGGKRRSKKSKKSRRSASKKSKKSSKKSRRSASKKSKKSKKSRRSASKKSKKSKKSRREANPQITVRGALVKYVWNHLDVKKVAADKGMHFIGVPAKIVQMVMTEAMKDHPMSEADKKSAAHWNAVQKTAMKLLADNLQKYAGMIKK
jgi:hypothetical protein